MGVPCMDLSSSGGNNQPTSRGLASIDWSKCSSPHANALVGSEKEFNECNYVPKFIEEGEKDNLVQAPSRNEHRLQLILVFTGLQITMSLYALTNLTFKKLITSTASSSQASCIAAIVLE